MTEAQRKAASRARETEQQRQERLQKMRERKRAREAKEGESQRQQRRDIERERQATHRANATEEERQLRRDPDYVVRSSTLVLSTFLVQISLHEVVSISPPG